MTQADWRRISVVTIILIVVCDVLTAGLVLQGALLTRRIHKLEEERL